MLTTMTRGRVLIIAGSDPSGGAGIQADIKAVTALGGYAAAALTALTAQNTLGVSGMMPVPSDFVADQVRLVLTDIGADVIKTGMLYDAAVIEAVAATLELYGKTIPLVLDPVMVAKGGAPLLQEQAITALKTQLFPRALLLTPNIPEAELLTGLRITTPEAMEEAAYALLLMGVQAVLLKGGHLPGEELVDVLVTRAGCYRFTGTRINTRHTHGTGCTLASAIACLLTQGILLEEAVQQARHYVAMAIRNAPGYGQGHGPLGVVLKGGM